MMLNTNTENRFNLICIYRLKDRHGKQERDTEKIERWRKRRVEYEKFLLSTFLVIQLGGE